jgi:hypothetical protein
MYTDLRIKLSLAEDGGNPMGIPNGVSPFLIKFILFLICFAYTKSIPVHTKSGIDDILGPHLFSSN